MGKNKNILAEMGVEFFGKISASATHEIKNTLAIINENAGLLEDLSTDSQTAESFFPKRGKDISQRLARQVLRADLILNRLNRFSHSADKGNQVEDIKEILCFVLDLTLRLVEQKGAVIEVTPSESAIIIDTNVFYLENMIWRAIEAACFIAQGEKKIIISFGEDVTEPSIWFSMNNVKTNLMDELFESKEDYALMTYLGVSIEKNIENNKFGFLWPKRI